MSSSLFAAAAASLVALIGFAGAANASATVDLIWADTGTNEISGVETSSAITLQVILTAGPNGSAGGGVSVDYSGVLDTLEVIGYMSTPGIKLQLQLGSTIDTGSRIENINSIALPHPPSGTGLREAGESHQLGTVTFHKIQFRGGTFEIRSDADGPTDGVVDLLGRDITDTTTFNSAFIIATPNPACTNLWGVTKITTIGKGQSPSNNPKVSHTIFGHIVDPGSLKDTAHRIPVCVGSEVNVAVTDSTGTPTNTAGGSFSCDSSGCSGIVNVTEKYVSVSSDGKDTDRMTLLPR